MCLQRQALASPLDCNSPRCLPYCLPVQVPKAAGAAKKKGKGKKLDTNMLGFASGTNYSLLEQPE
jgi:hypothetical protein